MHKNRKQSPGLAIGIDATNLRQGGGVTHLLELLHAAEPENYGITKVVVWGGQKTLAALDDRAWLEKINLPDLDKGMLPRSWWQCFKLSRAAKTSGCDVLFVPGGSYAGCFHPAVIRSRNMVPFEWRELRRYGWSMVTLKSFVRRWVQSQTFRRADGVIFLTEYARRGVLAALRQEGLPVELDLVGPAYPPALARLNKTIEQRDPHRAWVHYHGAIPYGDLHELYRQADLGIFASSCENMPNILLETMAAGLPVACSNRGPMPEVLGSAAVYFDPQKPMEIARALGELIDSLHLRAKKAQASYQMAQQFSWQRCVTDTFAFLTECRNSKYPERQFSFIRESRTRI